MSNIENLLSRSVMQKINRNPLQRPGGDELISTHQMGGPEDSGDRAFHINAKVLEHLLAMARSTPTQQVSIPKCGLLVKLYRKPNGHQYEVWTVVGLDPKPVPVPGFLSNT